MRFAPLALLPYALMAALLSPQNAPKDADVKAHRAACDRLCAAMTRKDMAGLRAAITPEFTYTTASGRRLTRTQFETVVQQQFATEDGVRYMRINPRTLAVRGNTMNSTCDWYFEGNTRLGASLKPATPGSLHKIDVVGSMTDNLVRTPQGWKFGSISVKIASMAIDGTRTDPARANQPLWKP